MLTLDDVAALLWEMGRDRTVMEQVAFRPHRPSHPHTPAEMGILRDRFLEARDQEVVKYRVIARQIAGIETPQVDPVDMDGRDLGVGSSTDSLVGALRYGRGW